MEEEEAKKEQKAKMEENKVKLEKAKKEEADKEVEAVVQRRTEAAVGTAKSDKGRWEKEAYEEGWAAAMAVQELKGGRAMGGVLGENLLKKSLEEWGRRGR